MARTWVGLSARFASVASRAAASFESVFRGGPWRFKVHFADSGRWSPVLFQLQQNGDVLTGTYNGRHGPLPITGSVTGTDIEFSFVIREETRVTYRGIIGDRTTMEGTCDYREVSGQGTWTAERANSVWDSL